MRDDATANERPQPAAGDSPNRTMQQSDREAGRTRPRKRGAANLERAHKTVSPPVEAAPGAPRSGSI
jgi:hypothetical protein